jgi:polyhydroxyalkanoate synthesis regulator phasin
MSIQRQYEREEELIDQQYTDGLITREEHTRLVNELWRDYREAAQEAAREAYERELDNW